MENDIYRRFTGCRCRSAIGDIFLPLTLIAGWYGMKVYMPEAAFKWAYPAIIGVSVLIIGTGILFFKHKKWFLGMIQNF